MKRHADGDVTYLISTKIMKLIYSGGGLAITAGLEPATKRLEVSYSIQLNYVTVSLRLR